jgi:SHS2 domain-containing protein
MGKYELFDHTADLGVSIEGRDLADLFRSAGRALAGIVIANPDSIEPSLSETVVLEAWSLDELLVVWLNELIFRLETRRVIFGFFDLEVLEGPAGASARGTIGGEDIDASRHILDHEVKAATRHGSFVRRDSDTGAWRAEVIVDI